MIWIVAWVAVIGFLLLVKTGMAKESEMETSTPNKIPTLNDLINSASYKYNVPVALIKAIIQNESNWDIYARNPNDPSYGLMQIMPIVAQDYGIVKDWRNVTQAEIDSIYVPANNIGCGTKLLGKLLTKYPMDVATQMYNVGEHAYNDHGARSLSYMNKVIDSYHKYLGEK